MSPDPNELPEEKFPSSEPLLEIYRPLSDKEKLNWLLKDHKTLIEQHKKLLAENQSLRDKNRNLSNEINEWIAEIPSSFKHEKTVSIKAFTKLHKRCEMFEKRVWELVEELKQLQNLSVIDKTNDHAKGI